MRACLCSVTTYSKLRLDLTEAIPLCDTTTI